MAKVGARKHEIVLCKKKELLESQGWRVVLLDGKSPDGIAIKDGKVVAIEILSIAPTKLGPRFSGGTAKEQKRIDYSMFDDVLFASFTL